MIKNQSSCRFMDKCGACKMQNRCISATSVTSDLRKYFLKIMGQRQKPTLAMEAGKAFHEEHLREWPSLAEMGLSRFQKSLYMGEKITLQEVSVCSPKYGLHGIIDKFQIEFSKDNIMTIGIYDLKPWWSKKYYKQLAVYGMILTDLDCFIAYDTITPRSHKKKRIATRLYPRREFELNIFLEIHTYNTNKTWTSVWMKDSVMTPISAGMTITIIKLGNARKELHKQGIYYLDNLAPCKDCKQLESYCSLYSICQKVVYNPTHKVRQLYHGKRELLVKTKPVIKR